MLPVVVADRVATVTILAHTVLLVLLSVIPFWLGMGWIYLLSAVVGGVVFLRSCIVLVYKPTIPQAWRVFAASIVQLGLLLTGAILDNLLLA
jgi:protoheme IX farnesyltransferase